MALVPFHARASIFHTADLSLEGVFIGEVVVVSLIAGNRGGVDDETRDEEQGRQQAGEVHLAVAMKVC